MNLFVTPWISLHNSPAFKTLPVIVFLSFVFIINFNIIAQTSDPNIPDTNGVVTSIVSDGQHIYVAGDFTEVGGVPRELVARLLLDGTLDTSWDSPLGGANGGEIQTMSIDTFAKELLIGGFIPSGTTGVDENGTEQTLANRTARIDLSTGVYLGSLTGFPTVNLSGGIIADENFVYVAGSNGQTAKLDKNNNYNSVNWNLSFIGNSSAFHRDADALYVNAFTIVQGTFSNINLAKIDLLGTVDESFKPAINNIVNAIATDDNYIYIGGIFTEVNGTSVNRVARLDKTTGHLDESWLPAANGRVFAISITENHVYIGGTSTLIKVDKTTGVNDPDWSASVSNNVNSILVQDEEILIGGNFNFLIDGAIVKRNLAKILPAQNFTPFITTWEVTIDDLSIYIPTGSYAYDFTIDWGDGTIENILGTDPNPTHTYVSAGTYTVEISGTFPWMSHLDDSDANNAAKLSAVEQWGDVVWENMSGMFKNASNLTFNAQDRPDLSLVNNMSFMFDGASSFDGAIGSWDVSNVTNMAGMFSEASAFNQPLGSWDVSKVTNMFNMFQAATVFNGAIGTWSEKTSNVTNMAGMFFQAGAFNQKISSWDVSSVTTMRGMFSEASAFNQFLESWDVSNVTNMNNMFQGATAFNQPIGLWDVSNVVNMIEMFFDASAFNQDLSQWNVSRSADLTGMFGDAIAFNQDLSDWDVSNVTNMSGMLINSGLSTANYDALLEGWSQLTLQNNVTLDASGLTYSCDDGYAARQSIIDAYGWNFNGDDSIDNVEPTVSVKDITVELDINGQVVITADQIDNGSSDNCTPEAELTFTLSQDTFTEIDTYTVTLTVKDIAGNTAMKDFTVIVEAADISNLTVASITDKTYTGKEIEPTVVVQGGSTTLVEGIDFELTYSNNINVGTATVTISGIGNFSGMTSQTFVIRKSPLTITVDDKQKTYGEANPALTFSYTSLVNGDIKVATEPSISTTASISSNVGTYPITLAGGADSNYDITLENGILTVDQKAVTITAESKSKVYGQANPDLTFTYSGLVNGDEKVATEPIVSATATASSNVGTYQITLEGAADANYDITSVNGTLTVGQKAVTITAESKSKVYGEANPDLTFTYSGLVNGDEKVATEPIVSATATASSNIGIYPITLTGAADANYDITLKAGELEVTQATLTITANEGQSKIFGTADLAFSYIASGFAAGDDKQVLTGTLKRDAGEAVGIYPINLGSLAAGVNYQIVFTSANFEIIPAVIESVMQPAPIEIIWGVYPELPSTVTVMTTDGQFLALPITWDLQSLYVFGNGEYPLSATITLPTGILNTEALTVEIVVTVLPKLAPEDILLDNNSFEAKAGQNFIAVGNLTVLDPIDNQHDISLADLAFDNGYFQINNGTLFWNSEDTADGRTTFKILVRVQDRDGNILEKEFTVIRNRTSVSNIEIFNTFTPDGDNVNDTWGVEELRFYKGVRMQVFDRGGERMFYTENPDIRWDGTHNGKELPIGTYYWTLEVRETGEVRKGMLNLLRK